MAENEARFEQAISADFGHRASIETTIAEVLFLDVEIKHALKHVKKWMAPRRVATSLQFMPGKNRLIPQPLGVVGIIAPGIIRCSSHWRPRSARSPPATAS